MSSGQPVPVIGAPDRRRIPASHRGGPRSIGSPSRRRRGGGRSRAGVHPAAGTCSDGRTGGSQDRPIAPLTQRANRTTECCTADWVQLGAHTGARFRLSSQRERDLTTTV